MQAYHFFVLSVTKTEINRSDSISSAGSEVISCAIIAQTSSDCVSVILTRASHKTRRVFATTSLNCSRQRKRSCGYFIHCRQAKKLEISRKTCMERLKSPNLACVHWLIMWGETDVSEPRPSLAHCSSPRVNVSGVWVMMPSGVNSWLVYQSSLAVLPAETSAASRRNGRRNENFAYSVSLIRQRIFYMP
jgi:hypothetical protein